MEQELLTFDKLLTWEDILALGCPFGSGVIHLDRKFFHICCRKNYYKNIFDEAVEKYYIAEFKKLFPDFPYSTSDMAFSVTLSNSDGKWIFKTSESRFITWLLKTVFDNGLKPSNRREVLESLKDTTDDLKEGTYLILKTHQAQINDKLNQINIGIGSLEYNTKTNQVTIFEKDGLQKNRKCVNWCIRNLDKIFEFMNRDISLEIFNSVNKDAFLLNMVNEILDYSSIKEHFEKYYYQKQLQEQEFVDYINYLNNYSLMVKYLEEENSKKYSFTLDQENGNIVLSESILDYFYKFDLFMSDCSEYQNIANRYTSYQELLSEKASKTWKKIQNEKLVKSIKLNWEMIPSGEKVTLSNYSSSHIAIKSNKQESQAALKKAYDLVEEKLKYFDQTPSIASLTGINNFKGYAAFIYPNGVVILEKFFKLVFRKTDIKGQKKQVEVPVSDEAIYVMNVTEFSELSKYTKMELIEEINTFNNPDVRRIYHKGNWQDRLTKIINGVGYTNFSLEDLEHLSKELSANQKIKTKTM